MPPFNCYSTTCQCAHLRTLHARRYPSQLAPLLYLGDWSHAEAVDRHAELGIKAVGSWDGGYMRSLLSVMTGGMRSRGEQSCASVISSCP